MTKQSNKETLNKFYHQMVLIRTFEERAAEQYMLGKIRGFLHLYIGEEAIAVGAISALQPQDYIATHYRDHGHALARGMSPKVIMAELFGKTTGCSNGMGGSMHLFDSSLNFVGGYAIVGGQLPIAVGLGLSSLYKGEDRIAVCFLGDGALNQGGFHEAMNMTSIWNLPVLFLCENNLYGMGAHVSLLLAKHNEIYRLAEAYNIPSNRVDGMDVLAVQKATEIAVESIRSGHGPYFLEAATYRFRGHSMADPAEYRTRDEERLWQQKDPIATYKKWLLESDLATQEELELVAQTVEAEVEEAIKFADESPNPAPEALFQNIYWGS
ncbi:pyruvate dehydrogenase (acetyl-transferring) E1 component subunit alpha [Dehalococcoidia bacterium]|nr:pyruvate dehydrogenase (acetyl-transferring) E1 component subunit alpha [Dehalococcoidia bacterium]